ncbi:PIN domain-containing protein [Haloarcula hispanica]|uniref:PIN domain-containing protein n=1 Tax=Haloarcula hispanica TaxID=51589 RepID=A0A5J5LHH4_HALHI|nr:PIN domain-containing protein [Haloarcula hispanica]KAA9408441.1 PIN domain-containing protein [Haloarcula hispanica]
MILDTNFISNLINGNEEAWEKALEINEKDENKSITEVVLFELYYGAFADENEELVRLVSNIATMYDMKNLGEEEIIEGAKRLAEADNSEGGDSGVGYRDGMIGGVAACHSEVVLTENVTDFEKLDVDIEEFNSDSD